MGKVTAGMLLGVIASIFFVVPASAAEIPPTNACVGHFKTFLIENVRIEKKRASLKWKKSQQKRVNREFRDTDCVTDFEWLMKPGKAKPYSEQCVQGVEEAKQYWEPISEEFRPVAEAYYKRILPVKRKIANLRLKTIMIRINSGKSARVARLKARISGLRRTRIRVDRTFGKAFRTVLDSQVYQTNLIFIELSSRRCIGENTDIFASQVPMARAVNRYRGLVISSLFYLAFKLYGTVVVQAPAAASSAHGDLRKLPLTSLLPPRSGSN